MHVIGGCDGPLPCHTIRPEVPAGRVERAEIDSYWMNLANNACASSDKGRKLYSGPSAATAAPNSSSSASPACVRGCTCNCRTPLALSLIAAQARWVTKPATDCPVAKLMNLFAARVPARTPMIRALTNVMWCQATRAEWHVFAVRLADRETVQSCRERWLKPRGHQAGAGILASDLSRLSW